MSEDEDTVASADQDYWVAFSERLREGLSSRIQDVPAMTPGEAVSFVSACQQSLWFGITAATYDHRVGLESSRRHFD